MKPGVQKPHCEALYSAKRSAGTGFAHVSSTSASVNPVQPLSVAGRAAAQCYNIVEVWTLNLAEALFGGTDAF